MVITATSRWATWESSWARTPSSSSVSRRRMRPVVTQTTAWSVSTPVAKALGRSMSETATRGLGMSALAHSRSTTPCSRGCSSGVTSRPRMAYRAMRSEYQYWAPSRAAAMTTTRTTDLSSTISAAMNAT